MTITSASGTRIASVAYLPCRRDPELVDDFVNSSVAFSERATFDGKNWNALIWCSWRETLPLGIEWGYTEAESAVLSIKYDTGREVRQAIDIPRGQGPRRVRISVP